MPFKVHAERRHRIPKRRHRVRNSATTHNLAEGAGAAPLAALLKERDAQAGRRVGIVLCGGNIDLELFRRWVMADRNTPS